MKFANQDVLAVLAVLASIAVPTSARYYTTSSTSTSAVLDINTEVTPTVIISNNAVPADDDAEEEEDAAGLDENEGWTVIRRNGVELAIRIRDCYDDESDGEVCPDNVYPSLGDGSYDVLGGAVPDAPGSSQEDPALGCPLYNEDGPKWCIDYSINTNAYDDAESSYRNLEENMDRVLADYHYELSLDADPTCFTDSTRFDPINDATNGIDCFENHFWFGDNDTLDGGGTSLMCDGVDAEAYIDAINRDRLVQQTFNYIALSNPDPPGSGSYDKIDTSPFDNFDPSESPATYTITLRAFCRDEDTLCKMLNAPRYYGSDSGKETGSTKKPSTKKSRKKSSKGTDDGYNKRYGSHGRELFEGPVEIASVTVNAQIDGGTGTNKNGSNLWCDEQAVWGNCPTPADDQVCEHGCVEIDGCMTTACRDSCLMNDWVYQCEKYEDNCDDFVTCIATGANAAVANGFITPMQSGSVKECSYLSKVCTGSKGSTRKSGNSKKSTKANGSTKTESKNNRRRRRSEESSRRIRL